MAGSCHTQSAVPSGRVSQRLHRSVSVSTARCPLVASISDAVDLPVPDIPVIRIFTILEVCPQPTSAGRARR
ncbi:hypothetical protein B0I32_11832 [Nonomuraea fuscirosea]|uniref:Uncharacterized protein n=1 Tax=Nonomuraea fuscirosea TaxID=1291556 RepID=A0A2T0MPF8_9ACTN|nr:hypothetical protein B0I32_11832 [Nonomuraea fuscirosea]